MSFVILFNEKERRSKFDPALPYPTSPRVLCGASEMKEGSRDLDHQSLPASRALLLWHVPYAAAVCLVSPQLSPQLPRRSLSSLHRGFRSWWFCWCFRSTDVVALRGWVNKTRMPELASVCYVTGSVIQISENFHYFRRECF